MKLNYPTYEHYKDSGVQWLGEIPSHWELRKLKYVFYEKRHTQNLDLNCGAISFGKVVLKSEEQIPESTRRSYQELLVGEFLINPLNMNYDLISLRIALSEINVVVSPGYIIINNRIDIDKRYFNYLLHRYDVSYMKLLGSGVRQTISFSHVSDSLLCCPPLPEQARIAAFLDKKTSQIDAAIARKEKQIALLKEHKQILIHRAVTRGLNPDAPMKDSGVEWIGQIPSHWEVKRLKYVATLQSGLTIKPDEFTEEGYPVYGGNGFRGFTSRWTNDGFFALIGRQGALCGNVNYADGKFFASEHAIIVYPLNDENVLWLGEVIKRADLNRLSQSAAQPGLAVSVINEVVLPYPPLYEQNIIATYIINLGKSSEATINLKQKEILALKELKTTLINAAVTGKIKV